VTERSGLPLERFVSAARISARRVFACSIFIYVYFFFYAKTKSGRAEPVGAANSAVSAARSAALTIEIRRGGTDLR
jgi:hypothetical protein